MTTALYLLGGLIVLFIISTLIPEGAFYSIPWLHQLILLSQLNKFYSSYLFYGLMALLFLSMSLCSFKHSLNLIKKFLRDGRAAISKKFLRSVAIQLIHIGIILVFVAAITKVIAGKSIEVSLSQGASYTVPNQQHRIKLNQFQVLLDKNGELKNYESDLSIYNQLDKSDLRRKLSVNHPLKLGNYMVYQSSYGKDLVVTIRLPNHEQMQIKTGEGQLIPVSLEESVLVYKYFPDFSGGTGFDSTSLSSEDRNPVLWLILRGEKPGSFMLGLGKKIEINGASISFDKLESYSGLKVVKDPSVVWMWTAFLLLSTGFLGIFYIPKEES
jgi:cytochrome c biogenesis protein ResB